MGKRIIVTGGSGKAGRHIIQYLLDQGHDVLNLDLLPLSDELGNQVHTLKVDLTDGGQVYSSISSHFHLTEPFNEPVHSPPDAVIHLAGIARNLLVPDIETYRLNTISAFNVIEASCRLGVKKIILASTVCIYGVTYAEGDVDFSSFPIDENIDVNPTDVYSLSKVCCEKIGRSFAKRFGVDIYALRIGAIIAPDEYEQSFKRYVNDPSKWKVHGWSYTDARDLGKMCSLGIDKDGLSFQIFNATNDHITNTRETSEFLKEQCPNTPFTRELQPREAPMSNQKIKQLLGFEQEHEWTKYYSAVDQHI